MILYKLQQEVFVLIDKQGNITPNIFFSEARRTF